MFRLFVALGLLAVLALGTALVAPPFIDWNQYRDRFEREASAVLGQPVKVSGATTVRLLPFPSVVFQDVTVAGAGGSEPLLQADSFRMDVELAPLLRGEWNVVRMELERPRVDLRLREDGTLAIPPRSAGTGNGRLSQAGVSFETVVVRNGAVRVGDDRTGSEIVVRNIDADASARALSGPWRVRGRGASNDERYRIDASTGRWSPEERRIRLSFALQRQSSPYDYSFDGGVLMPGTGPRLEGKLAVAPMGTQSDEDRIVFPRDPASPDRPRATAEADVVADARQLAFPAIELLVGDPDDPYRITGTGGVALGEEPRFSLDLEGQQVDLERLDGAAEGSGESGTSLAERFTELLSAVEMLPRPDLPGTVSLDLPAIVARDTVLREVGTDLEAGQDGRWTITGLSAELPGRTSLRAEGRLTTRPALSYSGPLTVASRQPSGLATWLGAEPDAAVRALGTVGFTAEVTVEDGLFRADGMELLLGSERLRGDVLRLTAADGEPARLEARLAGGVLDLDKLLAVSRLMGAQALADTLGEQRTRLDLDTAGLRWSDLASGPVRATLELGADRLDIADLSVRNLDGLDWQASGTLREDGERLTGNATGSVSGTALGPFLARLSRRFDGSPLVSRLAQLPLLAGPADLRFSLTDTAGPLEARVEGIADGTRVDASLTMEGQGSLSPDDPVRLRTVLENADAGLLLSQMGVPAVPRAAPERAALRLSASGTLADGFATEGAFTMAAGYLSGDGTVSVETDAERVGVTGELDLRAEVSDFDPLVAMLALSMPGYGTGAAGEGTARLRFGGDMVSLTDLKAVIAGTTVRGDGKLEPGAQPRPALSGTLSLSQVDAQWLRGLAHGASTLDGLDGRISLAADTVTLPGSLPPLTGLAATLRVVDGDLTLDRLLARAAGGTVSGTVQWGGGTAPATDGNLAARGIDLGALASGLGLTLPVSGKGDLSLRFEGSGTDDAQLAESLTGSGVLAVTQGRLRGVDPAGFAAVLAAADALNDDALAGEAEALVTPALGGDVDAAISLDGLAVDFTLAGSTVRAAGLSRTQDDVSLSGDLVLDLAERKLDATGTLAFSPGVEAVAGVDPLVALRARVDGEGARLERDARAFATYLGMRASERREREFEGQRAAILENQRLRRAARLYDLRAAAARFAAQERERLEQLAREQEEARKRAEARRRREEIERARVARELEEAERRAAREAAEEAGRRARREQEIEELRRRAEEAAERIQRGEEALPTE